MFETIILVEINYEINKWKVLENILLFRQQEAANLFIDSLNWLKVEE